MSAEPFDPAGIAELDRFRAGEIRPFDIRNPSARARAYRDWNEGFRPNPQPSPVQQHSMEPFSPPENDYFAPIGADAPRPQQPSPVGSGFGSGIPPQSASMVVRPDAAQRIAEANARRSQSLAIRAARSIARTDPMSWDDRIARYNRGAGNKDGLAISREDVLGQARRPSRPGVPMNAPPEATALAGMAPNVIPPRGGSVDTPDGSYRVQAVAGRRLGVPVMRVGGAAVPDPSLPEADFARVYTDEDAVATSKAIYRSGFGEFATRQRRIDAARAATLDESFSDSERARAEVEMNRQENALHREFIRSVGRRIPDETQASLMDGDSPDPMDVQRLAQQGIDRGMTPEAALAESRNILAGKPTTMFPAKQATGGGTQSRDSKRFDAPRFFAELSRRRDRINSDFAKLQPKPAAAGTPAALSAERLGGGSAGPDPAERDRALSMAFSDTLRDVGAGLDTVSMRSSFEEGLRDIAKAYVGYGAEAPEGADPRSDIRALVYAHLPLFWRDGISETDIDNEVERILSERIAPSVAFDSNP